MSCSIVLWSITRSVIHHKVINMQPPPLTGEVMKCPGGSDLSLWFTVFSVHLCLPACPSHLHLQPWLSTDVMECQLTSGWGVNWRMGPDLLKSGILQRYGLVIDFRRAARAPLVNKLYTESCMMRGQCCFSEGFPQSDIPLFMQICHTLIRLYMYMDIYSICGPF